MKTKLFLLTLTIGLVFTSCKKCEDCEMEYEMINGATTAELDAGVSLLGYASWDAYFNATLKQSGGEYCGDDLEDVEAISEETDLNADGTNDFRVYWDCK